MNVHSTSQVSRTARTPAAIVAKSAVCAAVVAGIAWIGFTSTGEVTTAYPSVNEAKATAGVDVRDDRAAVHRQQMFEERRARVAGRTPTQLAGGTHVEYPAP